MDERGRLKVDDMFRTTVPHIYAAGDVIGYPSLAATSFEQGRLAACHAFGLEAGPMSPHFPLGIYAVPEISMVGPTEQDLTRDRIPYETGLARYREIARGQILGDDSGLLKMLFHREDHRLLGVHAIGTGATELIHIGQAVLALGGGMTYFLRTSSTIRPSRSATRLPRSTPPISCVARPQAVVRAQGRRSTVGSAPRAAAASFTPRIAATVGATSS